MLLWNPVQWKRDDDDDDDDDGFTVRPNARDGSDNGNGTQVCTSYPL
jgi:hypothetical protein